MTVINLTEGDDVYTATTAGDAIFGLGGNDTITASPGGNYLWGGDGNDTLKGGDGNDYIVGDNNTNTTYHNILKGFGGDDTIISYSWYDSIAGGVGNDIVTVLAMTTGQIVDGGADSDTIQIQALASQTATVHLVMGSTFIPVVGGINGATYTNFETLIYYGGTGSNTIEGAGGNDTIVIGTSAVSSFDAGSLQGRGGDDHLEFNGFTNSGTGIETIDGGAGNDTLYWTGGNSADLSIDGVLGTMKTSGTTFATFTAVENMNITMLLGNTGTFTYVGVAGIDHLFVNATTSDIRSKDGNDFITINSGSATVDAGAGDDFVSIAFADTNSSTLRGGIGNDSLHGGTGQDQLYGEDGDDNLSTADSKTSLYGGNGADTLYNTNSSSNLGATPATLDGGADRDVLTVDRFASGTAFTVDFSNANITLVDGTQILRCEAIFFISGSAADNLISSNDAVGLTANKLSGNAGNDVLTASSMGATLDGGANDDTLIAGAGADKLIGGINTAVGDTASYANSAKGVTVDLHLLTAQGGVGDAAGDLLSFIENLQGSAHNDRLTGDSHKNVLTGGSGKDAFIYNAASDSSGVGFDAITDFDADKDHFQVVTAVNAIDNKVGHGNLTLAAFDADLGAALAGKLHAGRAILFTPDAGDYPAHTFLIIDQNGVAGYQSGGDIVLDITGANNLSSLSIADFTT